MDSQVNACRGWRVPDPQFDAASIVGYTAAARQKLHRGVVRHLLQIEHEPGFAFEEDCFSVNNFQSKFAVAQAVARSASTRGRGARRRRVVKDPPSVLVQEGVVAVAALERGLPIARVRVRVVSGRLTETGEARTRADVVVVYGPDSEAHRAGILCLLAALPAVVDLVGAVFQVFLAIMRCCRVPQFLAGPGPFVQSPRVLVVVGHAVCRETTHVIVRNVRQLVVRGKDEAVFSLLHIEHLSTLPALAKEIFAVVSGPAAVARAFGDTDAHLLDVVMIRAC